LAIPTVLLRASSLMINTFSLFEISKPLTLFSTRLFLTTTFSDISTQTSRSAESQGLTGKRTCNGEP